MKRIKEIAFLCNFFYFYFTNSSKHAIIYVYSMYGCFGEKEILLSEFPSLLLPELLVLTKMSFY